MRTWLIIVSSAGFGVANADTPYVPPPQPPSQLQWQSNDATQPPRPLQTPEGPIKRKPPTTIGVMIGGGNLGDHGAAGITAFYGRGLWRSRGDRALQFGVDVAGTVFGSPNPEYLSLSAGIYGGLKLRIVGPLAIEFMFGPAAIVDLGEVSGAGVSIAGYGAWLWKLDDASYLKLLMHQTMAPADTNSDFPIRMQVGVGLGYETRF